MKNNTTIAIIVLYNPDIKRLNDNINAIESQVDQILFVNNSETEYFSETGEVINNFCNLGIAKAINIGLEYAEERKYGYAVLLDQDSVVEENLVELLVKEFTPLVAMTVPKIIYEGSCSGDFAGEEEETHIIEFAITSGSCIAVDKIKKIGMMEEKLFIDSVDFEYCFKIRKKGLAIQQVNAAKLYQRLGQMLEIDLGITKVYPKNYQPFRYYYIVRNRLYVGRKYFSFNKSFFVKGCLRIMYDTFIIILFESEKVLKLKYTAQGIKDSFNNRLGKLKDAKNI